MASTIVFQLSESSKNKKESIMLIGSEVILLMMLLMRYKRTKTISLCICLIQSEIVQLSLVRNRCRLNAFWYNKHMQL